MRRGREGGKSEEGEGRVRRGREGGKSEEGEGRREE